MKPITRFKRAFKEDVLKKRKYKAFLRLAYDPSYRKDIIKLFQALQQREGNALYTTESIENLHQSHAINYEKWVINLAWSLMVDREGKPYRLSFIKIDGKLCVVDGNHRLAAMHSVFPKGTIIPIKVLS